MMILLRLRGKDKSTTGRLSVLGCPRANTKRYADQRTATTQQTNQQPHGNPTRAERKKTHKEHSK